MLPGRPAEQRSAPPTLHHMGFMVRDLQEAAEAWHATWHLGPFLSLTDVTFDEVTSGGAPAVFEHSIAFAVWGEMFIELQQTGTLSPAQLARGVGADRFHATEQTPVLNHLAYAVTDPEPESERLARAGLPIFMRGKSDVVQEAWHDGLSSVGYAVELHKSSPAFVSFFQHIRDVSANWDPRSDSLLYPAL